jgi:hypothetical protein
MSQTNRRRQWRRQRRLLSAMAAGLFALAGACLGPPVFRVVTRHARKVVSDFRTTSASRARGVSQPRHGRPVYPYSVIRGGAYSAAELVRALNADPVAARHYAVFRRSQVHTTASPFSDAVYLSYRVGEVIYWTSRAVRLPRGETLLTDGKNYARARCGNRISETPQTPVSDTEPAPSMLDQPTPPADIRAPDLETWAESRLVSDLSSPFALLVPASEQPAVAIPGAGPALIGGSSLPWLTGSPSGFLYPGDAASQLSPKLPPPSTDYLGEVIQPNPIPGLVFPTRQPVAVVLPGPVTWPAVLPPGSGTLPDYLPVGYLPVTPGSDSEVPEPGLLPPTILAVLAAAAVVRRAS